MIRLRALGQCVVEVGERRITPESDVLFALLVYLASNAARRVPRAELLELLWPGTVDRRARHRLRQALYQLRRMGARLITSDAVISLLEADVETDYRDLLKDMNSIPPSIRDSAEIEFLPDYAPTFSSRFARWIEDQRDHVHSGLRRRLLDGIDEKRAQGEHAEVTTLARACLDLDPLNGHATFALAESLAVQGHRAEALGVIDQYRLERKPTDEEASRSTTALRRRIVELGRRRRPDSQEGPLAGRSEILRELRTWVASGFPTSRILVFYGEPGIGKTRLLNEGVRIATLNGLPCVEYRANAAGEQRPLTGLIELLPQLLALPGAVGCSPQTYSSLKYLERGVHAERSIPADSMDSAFRFATLRRSVLDLFEAILAEGDVFVCIDDAHTLDRPTIELLTDATRLGGNRLLLLMTMRGVDAHGGLLNSRAGVRLVRVRGLGRAEARLIVTRDLAPAAVERCSRLIEWAVELADGNPFFLVELSAHCRTENADETFPESLQNALDRKIEALSPSSRLLIQSCAILGENSTFGRLDGLLGLPAHVVAVALSELEASGLISSREGRATCRHELIRDAVLRSVTSALGAYLHRRCAVLLATELTSSPTSSLAWDCVRHWDGAHDHARALETTGLIVDQLLSLGLPADAARLCREAEQYCLTPEQHSERLLKLSRAQRLLYDWDGVVQSIVARQRLLGKTQIRSRKYSEDEIALFEARWWQRCDASVLRPALHRVVDTRAPLLHRLQMAVLASIVADNHHRRDDARRIAEAVASLEPETPPEALEKCKVDLIFHTAFGDLDRAVAAGRRVVSSERRTGNSAALLKALRWLSLPLLLTNDIAGSVGVLTEAFVTAERLGLRGEMWNAAFYLSGVALDCEDLTLALKWAPVVADLDDNATIYPLRMLDHQYFEARIEYMRGDFERAARFLAQSRALKKSIPAARGEQSWLALEVLLQIQRKDRSIPRRTLGRLYRLHIRTRDVGTQDFETAAIVAGLLYAGDRRQAEELDKYYARVRRSRIETNGTLRAVREQLARGARAVS